ncbi:MAG: hypothetical protein LBT43_06685 [Prevotella sp.]|jgi:addiction module HigA family antidote|nr:hypothetical protein [Prevotella sp.]
MAHKVPVPREELAKMLEEYQVPVSRLAAELGVSQSMVRQILSGRSRMGVEFCLRLDKFFGNSQGQWAVMQLTYECAEVLTDKKAKAIIKGISKVKKPKAATAKDDKKAQAGRGRKPKANEEIVKEKKPRGKKPAPKVEVSAVKAKAPRKPRAKRTVEEAAPEPKRIKTVLIKRQKAPKAVDAPNDIAPTKNEFDVIKGQEWPDTEQ